jgi:Flp pilus assembly protein TadD
MRMKHDAIREALLAGEITPAVTAHLDECPDCAALAADLRTIDELAPSLKARVAVSADFAAKTMARIIEDRQARRSAPAHDDAIREALLAGEITPAVTAHLDECPDCAALAADLRTIDELAPSPQRTRRRVRRFRREVDGTIVEDRQARHPQVDPAREADHQEHEHTSGIPLPVSLPEVLIPARPNYAYPNRPNLTRLKARIVDLTPVRRGFLLAQQGNSAGAETAWQRADQEGHPDVAYYMGALLAQRGDLDGAEAAWKRADERGHHAAAHNLGVLLSKRNDLDGAEAAYRRADERGHAGAACNLGALLAQRGDLDGAEAAWQRAQARGHDRAAHNLALLLAFRQRLAAAETTERYSMDHDGAPWLDSRPETTSVW